MTLFKTIIEVKINNEWYKVSIQDIRIYKEIASKQPIKFVGIEDIRILAN